MTNTLSVMDPNAGDLKHTWDPENGDEVSAVRGVFDEMKEKGFCAYRVKRDGERAALMSKFDPEAGSIIMAPPIAGG